MFLVQILMWVMIVMGQIHRYKSCVEKERKGFVGAQDIPAALIDQGRRHF